MKKYVIIIESRRPLSDDEAGLILDLFRESPTLIPHREEIEGDEKRTVLMPPLEA